MVTPAKTKAAQLVDRVNQLTRKNDWDQFTIAKLRKEADLLIRSDAFYAHILLGRLAAMEGDIVNTRKFHEIFLQQNPNNAIAISSYSSSLNFLSFYQEAREMALRAYEIDQSSKDLLNKVIEGFLHSCRYQDSLQFLDRWDKLNPGEKHNSAKIIRPLSSYLYKCDISDDQVELLQDVAVSVLHQAGIILVDRESMILQDEESEVLSTMLSVDRSVKDVVDLNFTLAEKLAQSELPHPVTDHVHFVFISAHD